MQAVERAKNISPAEISQIMAASSMGGMPPMMLPGMPPIPGTLFSMLDNRNDTVLIHYLSGIGY